MEAAVPTPPGAATGVVVANADPTYAVIEYGGNPGTLALVHQVGAGWTLLGQGSPQIPCVNGLPVEVGLDFNGYMQSCG
jgi:hypothetical protein